MIALSTVCQKTYPPASKTLSCSSTLRLECRGRIIHLQAQIESHFPSPAFIGMGFIQLIKDAVVALALHITWEAEAYFRQRLILNDPKRAHRCRIDAARFMKYPQTSRQNPSAHSPPVLSSIHTQRGREGSDVSHASHKHEQVPTL